VKALPRKRAAPRRGRLRERPEGRRVEGVRQGGRARVEEGLPSAGSPGI